MRLLHVSEETGITRFEPRARPDGSPAVWAIHESRLHNYLLPRDCPRVTCYATPTSAREDVDAILGTAPALVAIEAAWEARCRATPLVVYELPAEPFMLEDEGAGYFVSERPVEPIGVETIDDPLARLATHDVDVRVLPCLWALREAVASSTLAFSIIRMRNAAPPPDGFVSRFPVPR